MVKLRRLKIDRFRIVQPGTELHFHEGVNLLLGLNGTGKTTLLDLIARLLGGHFRGLQDEELKIEYDIEVGGGLLQFRLENRRPGPIEVLSQAPRRPALDYHLEIMLYPKPGTKLEDTPGISWDAEAIVFFDPEDDGDQYSLPGRLLFEEASAYQTLRDLAAFAKRRPLERALAEVREEVGPSLARLDEGIDWLRNLLELASITVTTMDDLETTWIERREGWIPEQWVKQAVAADSRIRVLSAGDTDVPVLAEMASALGYKHASMNLELESSEQQPDGHTHVADRLTFGKQRFYFTKRDGRVVPLERLSFGQKRVIAFVYYLALAPAVVVADELTNGMHHSMIADCFRRLGDRQAFLATQSPLLLDYVTLDDPAMVRATFIRCRCTSDGPREQMQWSHLTEEEADEVFGDYKVGIQHTNEILRTRGLW